MYAPDDNKVYGSRREDLRDVVSLGVGVESLNIVFLWSTSYSLVQTFML